MRLRIRAEGTRAPPSHIVPLAAHHGRVLVLHRHLP
jgi:hypothetical protein